MKTRLRQRVPEDTFVVAAVENHGVRLSPESVNVKNRVARLETCEGDLICRVTPSYRMALEPAISEVVVVRGEDRSVEASYRINQFWAYQSKLPNGVSK